MTIEKQIKDLTESIAKKCIGQGASVVIGAALNLIATAADSVPEHSLHKGIAQAFRTMADEFDGAADEPSLISIVQGLRRPQ